eukprot:gb/GEZN01003457.1/.p1 GENE.gb/GEZN01003457.1/~~gb/GEZN01003457.1/.p1  ORF type:complete len:466 (+),score=72.24 gb/GEZN01003457.1/:432-1829(+)
MWGGRFSGKTDPRMEAFNQSISFDKRMAQQDIKGSQAYARALAKVKIITQDEAKALVEGLAKVAEEWRTGTFQILPGDEDIHMANERRLGEIIGSVAGKLHTGRSRNDQVATDTRLWVKDEVNMLRSELCQLLTIACDRAEEGVDVLLPGYTHLQPAQPIRWGHWVMSHASAFKRDYERYVDMLKRCDMSPLGSGALAGHPFKIDRTALAKDLGFSGGPTSNSLDAVSDRDFVVEFIFASSLLAVHLSRFAEDLIIYSTSEFGFVKFADAYATGSSLMPQKKNPDALELLRGKSARVQGALVTVLTAIKGIPSTYNKDLQEDKPALFDAADTMRACVPIASGVLATLTVRPDRMRKALAPEMLATDLADYLVRKGVPFRETHHIAGRAVKLAEDRGVKLDQLTAEDLKTHVDSRFEADVVETWSFEKSVESRDSDGGTSKRSVLQQIKNMRAWIKQEEENIKAAK